ncbi:oxidoreductase, short chain dehydrogenase/reductase family protein [Ancylostoma ceylanicum]|uniref:Oxidoreductase, short chain dehydrogenase/reductase family protein n=1 Tax=Ancylostoma ceylanicum TaxID=53326 RepID=A0A0D6LQ42_9BILA|nr:oxidoreductase, short chain dehydrogenase/reductase family protein [Ancylostoma ceylanicum]
MNSTKGLRKWIVFIVCSFQKEGLKTCEEITQEGGVAHFYRCDVSDPQDLATVAAEIRKDPKLGRDHYQLSCSNQIEDSTVSGAVSICIVNAAVLKFGECQDLSYGDYKLNTNVNILGHIYTVKAFLPEMITAQKGQIVSIGSICSYYGERYGTAYCAAKFACRGFMEALQAEIIEKGLYNKVVLTSIFPYFVRTGFIENLEEPYSTFFEVIPLEKCAREIVEAILKDKQMHFIPGSIGVLCLYLKCLTTKSIIPYARKVFNFSYEPRKKSEVFDV